MSRIEPGRIVAQDLGRRFDIAVQGNRTIRGALLRGERAKPRPFWALRHVDLDIAPGETFGIIGRNGSGKSTLLKMLARIFGPTEGTCEVGGRLSSLLELGAGFHPEFTAIENIYLAAAIYGIPRDEIRQEVESIIDFAELEEFKDQPVKTFSSGMFARLGFSVAMHVRPDVLLLDEALSVGDEAFVKKCFGRIDHHRRTGGTIVFVSHDPHAVQSLCSRAIVLSRGTTIYSGSAVDAIEAYHHHLEGLSSAPQPVEPTRAAGSSISLTATVSHPSNPTGTPGLSSRPLRIDLKVTSDRALPSAIVAMTIRDAESGQVLGSRLTEPGPIAAGLSFVTFDTNESPLLSGRFTVDGAVLDGSSRTTIHEAKSLTEFSIFGSAMDAGGPILLPGKLEARVDER